MVGEEVRRKGCVSLKGPKQEGIGSETEMSGGLLELPANLNYFSTLRKGLFGSSEVKQREWLCCP